MMMQDNRRRATDEIDAVGQALRQPPPRLEVVARGRDSLAALAAAETVAPRRGSVLRPPARLRRPVRLGLTAAAAAACAGAIFLGVARSDVLGLRSTTPSLASLPSPAALRHAMLIAFDSVSGDILYERTTYTSGRTTEPMTLRWAWPALAHVGQRVLSRGFYLDAYGHRYEQFSQTYRETAPSPRPGAGQLPGEVTAGPELGHVIVDYIGRIWQANPSGAEAGSAVQNGTGGYVTVPVADDPAALRVEVGQGDWKIVGRVLLDGQWVIKLQGTNLKGTGVTSWILWVSERTFLPVRQVAVFGSLRQQADYRLLPPAPANLALLRIQIPAGFRQVRPTSPDGPWLALGVPTFSF